MALQKTPVQVNFGGGVDSKTDPAQVQLEKFIKLDNVVFNRGALNKRNGFELTTTLPDKQQTTLTTLNDNLLATGTNLYAYSEETGTWLNQGVVQPVTLRAKALVRTAVSQSQTDSVTSTAGLTCTVYTENALLYYQISDTTTGQLIKGRTAVGATAVNGRAFVLGQFFVITFMQTAGGAPHLQYIAIPLNTPTAPRAVTDISTNVASLTTGYDGQVAAGFLYLCFGGSATTVKLVFLNAALQVSTEASYASATADLVTVTTDTSGSTPIVYATWFNATTKVATTVARSSTLSSAILAPTTVTTVDDLACLTSTAKNGTATITYQVKNTVAALGSTRHDTLKQVTVTTAGVVSSPTVLLRGLGLGSKAFLGASGIGYVLAAFGNATSNQPSLFLIDYTGNVLMRLAYSNAGGYIAGQVLPSVSTDGNQFSVSYLYRTLVSSINKTTGSTTSAGIYAQTGVNLASFSVNVGGQYSAEISSNLHLTGGQVWQYDGVKPVEHGFHVWPEQVTVTTATGSGNITAQDYFYAFCYEWTDGAGLLHRSAPSIPVKVTTTTATSTNTVNVPTLTLTAKNADNKVRLVGYRYSAAQQNFYQFTSMSVPTINDTTVDYIAVVDAAADLSIVGNNLLYTTGGVLENICAPAAAAVTLHRNRMMVLDAENRNTVWYSKPVVEAVPVEFTDLQTIYVAPTAGTSGSTGEVTALASMDDKLIIFKENALYYVTGQGPDITGANNDYSDPIFVTGAVGCSNPSSIVLMPQGLMFQSNKGIWLLGRDLSTQYIGADVEGLQAGQTVTSAVSVPGVNQVRFTLSDNSALMYDYFYQQWCTFSGILPINSTIYQGAHTILNSAGQVQREGLGYLDIARPVLVSFKTAWIKLTGLQGYQRAYFMYLLGTYQSPHRLSISMAYDYDDSIVQTANVKPLNADDTWGSDPVWGASSPWGGGSNTEQYRIFFDKQRCQAIQVTVNEVYVSADGAARSGLSFSSMNFVIGAKKGYPTLPANQSGS